MDRVQAVTAERARMARELHDLVAGHPHGRVHVVLKQADGALRVRVTSPYADADGPRAPGSGAGLVGMRERAALLGGSFDAGPDGALWTVRAALPLTEEDPA